MNTITGLVERLIKEVKEFEKYGENDQEDPSPEVVYQCNLLYLSKLFELIEERYYEEFIEDE